MKNHFTVIPAVHLFLLKEDQVLLLRRFNTGYEDGNYSVPAGHLNGGETATQAMIREAKEETNLELHQDNLQMVHVMHRFCPDEAIERIDFFYTARQWSGQPMIAEPLLCDELRWEKLSDLSDNTILYIRKALELVARQVSFSEFGWEDRSQ